MPATPITTAPSRCVGANLTIPGVSIIDDYASETEANAAPTTYCCTARLTWRLALWQHRTSTGGGRRAHSNLDHQTSCGPLRHRR